MRVFSFDRDLTVTTGGGPVPLRWVKRLAEANDTAVYAHGNQALTHEAGIPGMADVRRRLRTERHSDTSIPHVGIEARLERVRMVQQLHPTADQYVCVDDISLHTLEDEGWTYYAPAEFVREYADRLP